MEIIVATTNAHKFGEVAAILNPLLPAGLTLAALTAADTVTEPDENGATFEANALIKARFYAHVTGKPCLSDDSGLCVDALNGAPGIRSSRYAPTDAARIEKLLAELAYAGAYDSAERTARFVCCAALALPDGEAFTAEGVCEGVIASEPYGAGGFGYDPVFLLTNQSRTMAQLSSSEKNDVSHRGRAMRSIAAKIARIPGISL
ncbi:MAG TPA: RdgB/HAM1 family non-canonical purine NTP pyrophosphatase [Capsulimonadaceae bacterium]|jgi:XTP/dITP diphosphohydrolase